MRVFVSHSHQDNEFGLRLVNDLRPAMGGTETVWFDAAGGLKPGDRWWRTIVEEIKARPVFLVILSPAAVGSRWVNDEIDMAWRLRNDSAERVIIPILYQSCTIRTDLGGLQVASFLPPKPYEQALSELLNALSQHEVQGTAVTAPESLNYLSLSEQRGQDVLRVAQSLLKEAKSAETQRDTQRAKELASQGLPLFAQATRALPQSVEAWCGLAEILLYESNRTEDALTAAERAISLDPTFPDAWFAKARAQMWSHHEFNLSDLDRPLALDPLRSDVWYFKARLLRMTHYGGQHDGENGTDDELMYYDSMVAAFPAEVPHALSFRAEALSDRGRVSEAISAAEQAILADTNNTDGYIAKGTVLEQAKRFTEALEAYDQATRLEPGNLRAFRGKCDMLRRLEQLEDILTVCNVILRNCFESCSGVVDWRHESTDTTDSTDAQALS